MKNKISYTNKNINLIEVACDNCLKIFLKNKYNIKAYRKKGYKMSCSTECRRILYPILGNHTKLKRGSGVLPNEFTPFRTMFAKIRNYPESCFITIEDVKQQWDKQNGICPYTGIKMLCKKRTYTPEFRMIQASIDRIDSSKPYTKDNIEIVCLAINFMKNNSKKEDVIKFLKMMDLQNLQNPD